MAYNSYFIRNKPSHSTVDVFTTHDSLMNSQQRDAVLKAMTSPSCCEWDRSRVILYSITYCRSGRQGWSARKLLAVVSLGSNECFAEPPTCLRLASSSSRHTEYLPLSPFICSHDAAAPASASGRGPLLPLITVLFFSSANLFS